LPTGCLETKHGPIIAVDSETIFTALRLVYKDPRRASYFEPSGWSGKEYVGLRRGINMKKADSYFSKYSRVNISASAPVMWMNAAEIAFLRAEGKAIFGFNMGGEAKDFYNEGIDYFMMPALRNIGFNLNFKF
jgi:hypothetical protein